MNRKQKADGRRQEKAKQVSLVLFFLLSVYCLLLSFTPSAHACPLCKDALSKMGEIWTAIGFNLSVYFMMAMPFVLIASFGIVLYLNYRKHHRTP